MPNESDSVNDANVKIRRSQHNKEKPYYQICRKSMQDPALSLKAKGLFAYLLSLPDHWQIRPRCLARSLGCGKDSVYACLNELIKAGYCIRTTYVTKKGLKNGVSYEIFEEKITVSGNPDPDNPDTDNQTQDINKNTDITEKIEISSSLKVPEEPSPDKSCSVCEENEFVAAAEEIAPKIIETLQLTNKAYQPVPTKLIVKDLARVMRDFNVTAEEVMRVVSNSMGHNYWGSCFFKAKNKNTGLFLYKNFPELFALMSIKPKKERKFCPSSDDAKATEQLKKAYEGAI